MGYVQECNYGMHAGVRSWYEYRSPLMGYVHEFSYGIYMQESVCGLHAGIHLWDASRRLFMTL